MQDENYLNQLRQKGILFIAAAGGGSAWVCGCVACMLPASRVADTPLGPWPDLDDLDVCAPCVARPGNEGRNMQTNPSYPGSYSTVLDNVIAGELPKAWSGWLASLGLGGVAAVPAHSCHTWPPRPALLRRLAPPCLRHDCLQWPLRCLTIR